MNVEQELVTLCKNTIDILLQLRKSQLITEEELQLHLREKNNFIKRFGKSVESN